MRQIVNQILRQLASGPKDFWQLIVKQDSSVKEFIHTLKELNNSGVIEKEGPLYKLNTKNLRKKPHKYLESKCPVCGVGIDLDNDFVYLKEQFRNLVRGRPLPSEEYDQGFMRQEDTVRRAVFMYERGDVEDKNIFILGDDDLLSLAIGLMKLSNLITVVEADRRIVDFINEKAKKLNLNKLQAIEYNAMKELPSDLCNQYHTFVTDPVETWLGFKIFVGRCIQSLKGAGCSGYFGLTHLEASLKKWYEFQKFLINCNFVITDILRDFSFYPEDDNKWQRFYSTYALYREIPDAGLPKIDWYRSSFIRIEAIDKINSPRLSSVSSSSEEGIYFDEEAWATPRKR